jgi:hypothetical protein
MPICFFCACLGSPNGFPYRLSSSTFIGVLLEGVEVGANR